MYNKIAIFGLTGDPFTVAHREICKQAIDKLPIDKLYVIPTVVSYHREGKQPCLTDDERVRCAREMLWSLGPDYNEMWEIDESEINLKAWCRIVSNETYKEVICRRRFIHTLLDFHGRWKGAVPEIVIILGTDSVSNFKTWYRYKDIITLIDGVAIINGRNGKTVKPKEFSALNVYELEFPKKEFLNVSGMNVRNAMRNKYDKSNILDRYLEDVKKFDYGDSSLLELNWI